MVCARSLASETYLHFTALFIDPLQEDSARKMTLQLPHFVRSPFVGSSQLPLSCLLLSILHKPNSVGFYRGSCSESRVNLQHVSGDYVISRCPVSLCVSYDIFNSLTCDVSPFHLQLLFCGIYFRQSLMV